MITSEARISRLQPWRVSKWSIAHFHPIFISGATNNRLISPPPYHWREDPMEIKALEESVKEILEGYNKRPKGWQFVSDPLGNILALGPEAGYRIKLMMINPNESLGVGVKIQDVEPLRKTIGARFDSGFRPLDHDLSRALISAISEKRVTDWAVLEKILRIDPVPTYELDKKDLGAILGGPFLAHPDLRSISKSQLELDAKLSAELDKLFRSRYPLRAGIYR